MTAPIVLFTYAREQHTRQAVAALQKNILASDSDLIIYSDGPRGHENKAAVEGVRKYLATISGFRSVTIRQRQINFGLAKSIIQGVTEVLNSHEHVIVLEDDLVTSPFFLTYMNEALELFRFDARLASIHGYVYPVNQKLPEAFFLRGADCWGWATWRRAWDIFNPDGKYLLAELRRRHLIPEFDFNGTYPFSAMLEAQIRGNNDSWAIRWHASAFLADMLTLYPGRSLVQNIGHDRSGTHSDKSSVHDSELSKTSINLRSIEISTSEAARSAFQKYFEKIDGSWSSRFWRRILRKMSWFVI